MSAIGAGAPRFGISLRAWAPVVGLVAGVVVLAGCGGGGTTASTGAAAPSASESVSAPTTAPLLTPFPDGNTYWRNAVGAPVIAYKADSRMCFFYWSGLGYMPVFSGSLTEVLKQWNWEGIEGRYAYESVPGSTSAVSLTFKPDTSGSGVWYLDGVFGFDPKSVAEGSPDPVADDTDAWAPSTREQASIDYANFLGLEGQQFEVPSLTSCPTSADFV